MPGHVGHHARYYLLAIVVAEVAIESFGGLCRPSHRFGGNIGILHVDVDIHYLIGFSADGERAVCLIVHHGSSYRGTDLLRATIVIGHRDGLGRCGDSQKHRRKKGKQFFHLTCSF